MKTPLPNTAFLQIVLGCLAALNAGAAQAVTLFFDTGSVQTGVVGGPLDGSNPQITLSPGGSATLHLWAIPDPAAERFVVALGFDVAISGPAAAGVTALELIMDNPEPPTLRVTGSWAERGVGGRWSGLALVGGLNTGSKLVADQRLVYVPDSFTEFTGGLNSASAPFDAGYDPRSAAIHLGRLVVSAGAHAAAGAAELRVAVSPLKIVNVTTTGISQPELLRLGFAVGHAEPAHGDGSQVGATSSTADAVIWVTAAVPGDGDGDGDVDLQDFQQFAACLNGPQTPPALGAGCLAPFDFEGDGDIDARDFSGFQNAFSTEDKK